jgi:hypothetical protein
MPQRTVRDVSAIVPNLYVGSRPYDPDAVADEFSVLVLCAEEFQPTAADYHPMRVIRAPIGHNGLTPRDVESAVRGAAAAYRAFTRGERVLIASDSGMNRGPLVAAMVLMMLGGSATDAVNLLRFRRAPVMAVRMRVGIPHDARALANPKHVAFLKSKRWKDMLSLIRNK